jgi:hypothetical protein
MILTSLLLTRVTFTLSVKVGSGQVIAVPFLPTISISSGQSLTFGASPPAESLDLTNCSRGHCACSRSLVTERGNCRL